MLVVADVLGEQCESERISGDPRRNRHDAGVTVGGNEAGRLGRGGSLMDVCQRQDAPEECVALGCGHGVGEHEGDVGHRRASGANEAVLDVQHDLALDEQAVVEGQFVLREVDRALDRVLDRQEAVVQLAGVDGVEHVGHRAVRDTHTGA
ncbi:unannotated protein [freshwater metagenome]|uniref:Unannotated protein n=1 Tax=freshwater metagenome TaxID=449393 RepID=A0A6J7EXT7_9ZZZZ